MFEAECTFLLIIYYMLDMFFPDSVNGFKSVTKLI